MNTAQGTTGTRKRGGRRAGVPNKVTREFREAVAQLLARKQDNMERWLDAVAEGTLRVLPDGTVVGEGPNPAKALEIVAKLAEYAVPKMSRIEPGIRGAVEVPAIQIEFVDARAPGCQT